MPCLRRNFLALVLGIFFVLFSPGITFAATMCDCWCGIDGAGAVEEGVMTAEKCADTCTDPEYPSQRVAGCFTDPSQYPYESDKCWTEAECAGWSDKRNGETVKATWGSEIPFDCTINKSGTAEMHYCYAEDVPYELNIHIGDVTKVQNIQTYINVIYTWLLPAASLVAVVMMMIGGLQYVFSRGKSKYVEAAKTRITNAITGVVILMSIFVILNLIDPRLTSFESLNIPIIKEVAMLDPDASCERLRDYGYRVELVSGDGELCGSKGKITDNTSLKDNALGSWKVNDECDFIYCSENKFCISDNGDAECRACYDVPAETASAGTCEKGERLTSTNVSDATQIYCRYDTTLRSCTTVGTALGTTESRAQGFYCGALLSHALQSTGGGSPTDSALKGCAVYNDLEFGYSGSTVSVTDEKANDLFETVCTEDTCGIVDAVLKQLNADVPASCKYVETSGKGSCMLQINQ